MPVSAPGGNRVLAVPSGLLATSSLVALTVASCAGLLRVISGHSWVGPVLLTALVVHGTCWLLRRWRFPLPAALILGLLVLWLMTAWTVLGPFTRFGIPTGTTWSHFTSELRQAQSDVSTLAAPVPGVSEFRLVAALGAGLVALIGDAMAFRLRTSLLGASPAFALFVASCAWGQGHGRAGVILVEVATLLVYVLAQRANAVDTMEVWFAGIRGGAGAWTARTGAVLGAFSLLAAAVFIPLLGGQDGRGVLGWRGSLGVGGNGVRDVANPIVDLQTRLLDLSNTQAFTVQSPVASYWRLTSLDTFTGATWIASGSYKSFTTRLPGKSAVPPNTRQVQERFDIDSLDSVWLPAAFNPISITGAHGVSYDPVSNSLITARKNSNGLVYTVTSYQYLSTLNPAELEAAPPLSDPSTYAAYLQLPGFLPAQIRTLAMQITAGRTTEYDKAVAIQDYLRSPLFHYSLDPPTDGSGDYALTTFLFQTRTGYCQQFAGSYAVLARAAGLPTRLAVGFATGAYEGKSTYSVTDAYAHSWPEVYFGPQLGWLPFEPTPSFSNPNAAGYAGAGGASNRSETSPSSNATTPTSAPAAGPIQKRAVSGHSATTVPEHSLATGGGSGAGWLFLPPLLIVAACLLWVGGVVGGRRARWAVRRRRARGLGDQDLVLASWAEVSALLAWLGIPRRSTETDDEYAARAGARVGRRLDYSFSGSGSGSGSGSVDRGRPVHGELARLGALARQAAFAPGIDPAASGEASSIASDVRARLLHSATTRQRLAWLFTPRTG